MSALECPHGMGKATACTQCMEEGPVAKADPKRKASFWMVAKLSSSCPLCNKEIEPGEEIGRVYEGWACDRCSEPG